MRKSKKIISLCLTAATVLSLPATVLAETEESKTITIAWTNIMDSQQQIWEKYIFEPFQEKHPEVTIDFQCLPDLQNTVRVQVAAELDRICSIWIVLIFRIMHPQAVY